MSTPETDETRAFWDRVASDWDTQVGEDGDRNRILNSDPVLWQFAGDVEGLSVLDAGCGTGYLSRKLQKKGATVTGIDLSSEMIAIARSKSPEIPFQVDSVAELRSQPDAAFDLIISNYVLMDTPDLEGTLAAFARVLKVGGVAVLIFSHPCFPQGRSTADGERVDYRWPFPYFERQKCVDPPWGHFTSDFIWFHRPLSDYWKAFRAAGFTIEEFEEPRLPPELYHLANDEKQLLSCRTKPCSVAFKLAR